MPNTQFSGILAGQIPGPLAQQATTVSGRLGAFLSSELGEWVVNAGLGGLVGKTTGNVTGKILGAAFQPKLRTGEAHGADTMGIPYNIGANPSLTDDVLGIPRNVGINPELGGVTCCKIVVNSKYVATI